MLSDGRQVTDPSAKGGGFQEWYVGLTMARGEAGDGGLFYRHPGSFRFNVRFKNGTLDTRVVAAYIEGRKPAEIDWIWILEARRKATPEEVKKLCAGTWKGIS
jgi:hypothetical protein